MKKVNYFQREPFNAVLKAVMLQNFYAIDDFVSRLLKNFVFHRNMWYFFNMLCAHNSALITKIILSFQEMKVVRVKLLQSWSKVGVCL